MNAAKKTNTLFNVQAIQQQFTAILGQSAKLSALLNTEQKQEAVLQYLALLHKWNKAYNLTAIRDPQEMLIKHVFDALVVAEHIEGEHFIDVGTGAGIPGVLLAIVFPEKTFTLLDSNGKKVRFLKQVKNELYLDNIFPVHARIEEYTQKTFDGVISRAFASLEDMYTWCEHCCKPSGKFFAMKAQAPEEEIETLNKKLSEAEKNIYISSDIKVLNVPELDAQRHLVVLQKVVLQKQTN